MKETDELWVMHLDAWFQAKAHLSTLKMLLRMRPRHEQQLLWNEIDSFVRQVDDWLLNGIPDDDRP